MVTRPVMASMASAIRLNWRIVVIVTSGKRHSKSGTISTIGFCSSSVVVVCDTQRYYKSLIRSTSFLAKVLCLETDCATVCSIKKSVAQSVGCRYRNRNGKKYYREKVEDLPVATQ